MIYSLVIIVSRCSSSLVVVFVVVVAVVTGFYVKIFSIFFSFRCDLVFFGPANIEPNKRNNRTNAIEPNPQKNHTHRHIIQWNNRRAKKKKHASIHTNVVIVCIVHAAFVSAISKWREEEKSQSQIIMKKPTIEMWFHYLVIYLSDRPPLVCVFFCLVWLGLVSCLAAIASPCSPFG